MSLGGVVVLALVVLIAGYLTPALVSKRKAILLSREGDRFSENMHLVQVKNPSISARPKRVASSLLLASTVEEGKDVTGTLQRRPTSPATRDRRLSNAAARELSSLRAGRASRLASEAAAAKRRFVTFTVALFAFVVVLGLAVATVLSWWWLALPSTVLVGSAVASRLAAVRTERAHAYEKKRIRELKADLPAPGKLRTADARPKPRSNTEHLEQILAEIATEATAAQSPTAASEPDDVVADPAPADEQPISAQSEGWEVQELPKPSYLLKDSITRRTVHVDEDVAEVPRATSGPARPVAASVDEGEPVTFTFDLNAVLEARRAQ